MTNQVDTSPETIEREWAALEQSAGLDFSGIDGVEVQKSEPGAEPETPGQEVAPAHVASEDAINMATVMLAGGLKLGISLVWDAEPPEETITRCARAWAVVICKYYRGGVFEFLERYKSEIAAVAATLTLAGAVRSAKRQPEPARTGPKAKDWDEVTRQELKAAEESRQQNEAASDAE